MPTLVKCLAYSNNPSENLRGSRVKTDFRIDAPPHKVLKKTLSDYFLRAYNEVAPWIIKVNTGKGYIDITEIDSSQRVHGNLDDFLICKDFFSAKRAHSLTEQEKEELAQSILYNLSEDNWTGMLVSNNPDAGRIYSQVLEALGEEVSAEQVSKMLLAQHERKIKELESVRR